MSQFRSDLWCAAFVRRMNDLGHMCVVSRRGDAVAGQIFIEIDHLDGTVSLLTPAPALSIGEETADRVFVRRLARTDAMAVRERIDKEARIDPDFWVLSVDFRGDDPGVPIVSA